MGVAPWRQALCWRLAADHSDELVTITPPRGDAVTGRYVGDGSRGSQRFLIVNPAPDDMPVQEAIDLEKWIPLVRGVVVELSDGTELTTPTRRSSVA